MKCQTCMTEDADVTVTVVVRTTVTMPGTVATLPGEATWQCCRACFDKHPLTYVFKSAKLAEADADAQTGHRLVDSSAEAKP